MKRYKALWGTSLIVVSALATAVCVGTAIGLTLADRAGIQWLALLPIAIVLGGTLFTVRGYTAATDAILIHRLLWTTRLSLTGLESARVEPDAMRRSIRLCGNGGLFSLTGWYRNKTLGNYRAFVTDPHRTVVLRFSRPSGRTVVLSPAAPDEFVAELGAMSAAL